MIPALRIVIRMGGLHRLLPLWLAGLAVLLLGFTPLMLAALAYGVLAQFVVEYLIHRFVYHRDPPAEQSPFNALYRAHIGHHEFPRNVEFFTGGDHWFPFRVAAGSFLLHVLLLWLFTGLAMAAQLSAVAIFLGSASAFAFYEYCHTLAHLNVPKGWFGQRVTRSHMAHHYQDHEASFHVSFGMGWIDRLFGTAHDAEAARDRFDRRTMMSIGMDPDDLRLVTARKAWGIEKPPRHAG
ncbi:MAG: sterol desaturase family protein [Pseudooceanicola sp.]